MRMLRMIAIICLLCVSLSSPSRAVEYVEDGYVFGAFPYLSALRLEAIYAPVSAQMGKALQRSVHFRTAPSFDNFFSRLKQQHYDIALIQPFLYPPAVDQYSYTPLVRIEEPFTSLIMVLENSPLKDVGDLQGKVVATPPAFVPVVHMAKIALKEKGLIPGENVEFKAYKSVDSCFQQILIGAASACVAPSFAPAVIEEKMNIRLRVLLQTPSIPNLSLVVHTRVPPKERKALQKLFLGFSDSESGRTLLRRMKVQRFIPAIDSEYDVVRSFIREINRKSP